MYAIRMCCHGIRSDGAFTPIMVVRAPTTLFASPGMWTVGYMSLPPLLRPKIMALVDVNEEVGD